MIDRRLTVTMPAESLAWSDPAVQWGLGLFETIAVRDGEPRFVDEHLARLFSSAAHLTIPLPDKKDLDKALRQLAKKIETGHGWLKLLVSRSGPWTAFGGPSDAKDENRAVSAVLLSGRRHRLDPQAGMKTLASAATPLGLEEARRLGADEGVWLNDRGHVMEACTGNVFVLKGRRVTTPALSDGALPGITRARAMQTLKAMGYTVAEGKVRVDALRDAKEVFLTSSLSGVRPVVRLDGRDIGNGKPGSCAVRLADKLTKVPRIATVSKADR